MTSSPDRAAWEDQLRLAVTKGVDLPGEEWRWFRGEVEPVAFAKGERLVTEGRSIEAVIHDSG